MNHCLHTTLLYEGQRSLLSSGANSHSLRHLAAAHCCCRSLRDHDGGCAGLAARNGRDDRRVSDAEALNAKHLKILARDDGAAACRGPHAAGPDKRVAAVCGLHDELIQGGVVCAPTARVGLLGQVLAQGLLGCELAAELEPLAKGGEVSARRVREVVDVDVGAAEWVRTLEACVKGDTCITSEGVQAMQVSHSRGHHDLVRKTSVEIQQCRGPYMDQTAPIR